MELRSWTRISFALPETFKQLSKGVVLVSHRPPFPAEEGVDAALIIEPAVLTFSQQQDSILLRSWSKYTAHIEYKVVVFDRAGTVLLDKVVKAAGEYRGQATTTPGLNFAGAAEAAMRNAMASIVNDVAKIEVPAE